MRTNWCYLLWFSMCIAMIQKIVCDENVLVKLKQGSLSGKLETTLYRHKQYYAFRGIPYAVPPLGALRFLPPKVHEGWDGILEAYERKPTCLQFSSRMRNGEPFGISGSEDCLYINIYTPSLEGSLPVIVFDFNDNFRTGFNDTDTYSPDFFIEEEAIIVTINHRLASFGYLTTEDEIIPSNSGIRDFILGLKWIQDNIEKFGGNSNKVTIMGSRGGAALVNFLLHTEKAKGLFHAVILQSGTALEPIYFYNKQREKAFELGAILEIEADDSRTLLEGLQKLNAEEILRKESSVFDTTFFDKYQMSVYPFAPSIEKNYKDAIIRQLPEESSVVNDVPVLIGMNSREGLDYTVHFIFDPRLVSQLTEDFYVHFPIRSNFRFDSNSSIYKRVIRDINEYYFEAEYFYYGNILEYAVYIGDVLQNYALDKTAAILSENMESKIFYYMFDYRGLLNENSEFISRRAKLTLEHWGATVGDELCYLHVCKRIMRNYKELGNLPSKPTELKVIQKMVRLWTNFAKYGNPTPHEDDDVLRNFKWQPIDKNSEGKNYLHITKDLRMKTEPLGDRVKFWNDFLAKYSAMAVDGVVTDDNKLKDEL